MQCETTKGRVRISRRGLPRDAATATASCRSTTNRTRAGRWRRPVAGWRRNR